MKARAMLLGIVGRPGAPFSPLDLDAEHYLWFLEGLVRETGEENNKTLDDLYARARQKTSSRSAPEERTRALEEFLRVTA